MLIVTYKKENRCTKVHQRLDCALVKSIVGWVWMLVMAALAPRLRGTIHAIVTNQMELQVNPVISELAAKRRNSRHSRYRRFGKRV